MSLGVMLVGAVGKSRDVTCWKAGMMLADRELCAQGGWWPGRLWSLWDMLEFNGESFYRASAALSSVEAAVGAIEQSGTHGGSTYMSPETRGLSLDALNDLRVQLKILQAELTDDAAERMERALYDTKTPLSYADLSCKIDDLQFRLRDELRRAKLFVMSKQDFAFYEPNDPLFGPEVEANFLSASFDVAEAGKCIALKRPTAAVFHLMRTLEISIRAMARCLGISDPTRPAGRNWGFILKGIKVGIDSHWPHSADRQSGDGALFESLHASLDAVRNPWRNATMHIEQKYTDDEADHIFRVVRAFLKTLASRMDEEGEPKA